jgi:RNA polymerase sigma-54 factor
MAFSQRLDLRQSQQLVMTPQLQQAIKLLQLNNVELSAFVDAELERNPLLEAGDLDDSPLERGQAADSTGEALSGGFEDSYSPQQAEGGYSAGETSDLAELTGRSGIEERDAPLDTDYENVYTNSARGDVPLDTGEAMGSFTGSGGRSDFSDDDSSLERTLSRPESLREHLEQQIACDIESPVDRAIALEIIEGLDASGYWSGDIAEMAERLGCPEEQILGVMERVQRFDPPGICARSVQECLAIQLRELNRLDPWMQALLERLDLLARRDVPGLLKAIGCPQEDLMEMIAEIRSLNPRPASGFDHDTAQPVTPDVLMRRNPSGNGWIVELNPDTLPRVLVSQRYYAEVATGPAAKLLSKAERDFLTEQWQSANWLVKSLHQRATTIMKVAREIVRQQEAFFTHGVTHLRPLVLRNIAEAIDMHESTVSRVTSNKFIATPRGLYELKYFFTAAIAGADGQASHSAEAVRHRIKALIDQEVPDNVLSDDQIVATLKSDGVDVARRTVAKYREALGIPSSVQRRKLKMMQI